MASTSTATQGIKQDKKGYVSYTPKSNKEADAQVKSDLSGLVSAQESAVKDQKATAGQVTAGQNAATANAYNKVQADLKAAYAAIRKGKAQDAAQIGLTNTGMKQQNKSGQMYAQQTENTLQAQQQAMANIQAQKQLADEEYKQAWANLDEAKMQQLRAQKYNLQQQESDLAIKLAQFNKALKSSRSGGGGGGRSGGGLSWADILASLNNDGSYAGTVKSTTPSYMTPYLMPESTSKEYKGTVPSTAPAYASPYQMPQDLIDNRVSKK